MLTLGLSAAPITQSDSPRRLVAKCHAIDYEVRRRSAFDCLRFPALPLNLLKKPKQREGWPPKDISADHGLKYTGLHSPFQIMKSFGFILCTSLLKKTIGGL